MRKLFITSFVTILWYCNSYSQILPVEDFKDAYVFNENDPSMFDDGINYIKDVNNKLPKFTGTWKGQQDGITYEFRIEEYLNEEPLIDFKKDNLVMRYKLSNASGDIENTLQLGLDEPLIIIGNYMNSDSTYMFTYSGREGRCGQRGEVFVSLLSNSQMNLVLLPHRGFINGNVCTKPAEQILPTTPIALTKQ